MEKLSLCKSSGQRKVFKDVYEVILFMRIHFIKLCMWLRLRANSTTHDLHYDKVVLFFV